VQALFAFDDPEDGGRRPARLANDSEGLRLASVHSPVTIDEAGTKYKLDRSTILDIMSQIKISMDNKEKMITAVSQTTQSQFRNTQPRIYINTNDS